MRKRLIYILDDCQDVCHLLKKWLQQYGEVKTFSCSNEFLEHYHQVPPHLCIVDNNLHEALTGIEILKSFEHTKIPFIIITNDQSLVLETKALEFGALDLIHKPIDFQVLSLKVGNLLSLIEPQEEFIPVPYKLNENLLSLTINKNNQELVISFTQKEFLILKKLIQHQGANVSREDISLFLENNLQNEISSDRVIDYHICNIKKKLGENKSLIKPVYGIGYRFMFESS